MPKKMETLLESWCEVDILTTKMRVNGLFPFGEEKCYYVLSAWLSD